MCCKVDTDLLKRAMLLRLGEFNKYDCVWKEKVVLVMALGTKRCVKVDRKTLDFVLGFNSQKYKIWAGKKIVGTESPEMKRKLIR